jgi:alpha-L-rhamnosidase
MKRFILSLALLPILATAQDSPAALRVEYLSEPQGVDVAQPRFSWIPAHEARGARQSAFQIVVSKTSVAPSVDIWDSGKVDGAAFTNVAYAGKPLESSQEYSWKVRYWDQDGKPSPYSAPAHFTTGLLNATDWHGKWIAGGNLARKEFTLPSRPVRAVAYIAAVGYHELRINGTKMGDHVLDPAYTAYKKRVLYITHDVTHYLRQGPNAVGIMLGEGWFADRVALLQINVELAGGQKIEIVSDPTWKAAQGPILADSIYHGETYDARKEMPGWDKPGFTATGWTEVKTVESPTAQLSAQMMPPIRVIQDITPLKMTTPRPGVWIYDMGQNFSGWVRLRVSGPRGATVRIRHAELLYDDGTLNVENLRSARATDTYTLKGSGAEEVYEPRFTYHGFRYVEISGYPGAPRMDSVLGRVVHSDVKPIGGFSCSKPIINQIQHLVQWGITSNLHSVPTDCNQRDERMGWMADAHLYSESAMLNFDMAAFYTNFLRDIHDEQAADGSVPDTTPRARFAQGGADPAWGSAYPLILWYMYQQYGDRRLLEEHFDGICKWSDFLMSRSENGTTNFVKYGDWVPVERTPGPLVSTAYSYVSADLAAKIATILGKTAQAGTYSARAEEIKNAFNKRFYNASDGVYGNGSQTSNLLPIVFGIAPKDIAGRVGGTLRNDLTYKYDSHLTTGILGTKYMLPWLTRAGAADLAYDIAVQRTYPSWGYMIDNGATTLWELWQQKVGPSMNSHNHPMFGSIGAWFYNELAGISMPDGGEGYTRVLIRPVVIRDLKFASGSIETVRGTVLSTWQRTDNGLRLEVVIPFGSTARIVLPKLGLNDVTVTEGGKPVWKSKALQSGVAGLTAGEEKDGAVTLEAASGHYVLELSGL